MKSIIYIVAIVAIAAGALFSYGTMQKFEKSKADREEIEKNNEARKATNTRVKAEAKALEVDRDAAQVNLAEIEGDLDTSKSNLKLAKREAATWKGKIAEQEEKLEGVQNLIATIKAAFKELGPDLKLEEIPRLVKKLEDDLKESQRNLEELQSLADAADKRVASNTAQTRELGERIDKRAVRIKGNSAVGQITAINHDWGFAIVQVPSNMPVSQDSKLMIKRGSTFIGNLKINAIEGTRIVADVDYKSMNPGMVAQPGDSVVLAKPVTN